MRYTEYKDVCHIINRFLSKVASVMFSQGIDILYRINYLIICNLQGQLNLVMKSEIIRQFTRIQTCMLATPKLQKKPGGNTIMSKNKILLIISAIGIGIMIATKILKSFNEGMEK